MFTNDYVPKYVDKEITTYKIVCAKPDGLYTPQTEVSIPQIPYKLVAEGKPCVKMAHLEFAKYSVDIGYIHSYVNAKAAQNALSTYFPKSVFIIKSHIPIGAYCYYGLFDEIASTELMLDKVYEFTASVTNGLKVP